MSVSEQTNDIRSYVASRTERGDCKCGKCFDRAGIPDPVGHTADMIFFKVARVGEPRREDFLALSRSWPGEFAALDPIDGREHSYINIGAWLGDQGIALRYMALGHLLGVFELMTPRTMLPGCGDEAALAMAGGGLVCVRARQ